MFTQLDDYIGVSKVYTNLGNQAFVKADYAGAIHFYERSEEIVLHFNLQSTWATARNYSNMGMAAQRQGQHERADGFFKQAYAGFKELGHRARIAATCLHWSALYAELGNHEACVLARSTGTSPAAPTRCTAAVGNDARVAAGHRPAMHEDFPSAR